MRASAAFSFLLFVSRCTAEDSRFVALSAANTTFATDVSSVSDAEDALRRHAEIASRLAVAPAQGVKKMSTDEGEKFFLDYWQLGDDLQGELAERDASNLGSRFYQTSLSNSLSPRVFPHSPSSEPEGDANTTSLANGLKARLWGLLEPRDFKCPMDTYACTSIGRPHRCCSTGDTCELVKNTGSGDVGCCPNGETCSGTVGSCPSRYTTCSETLGGGCCIPGYECVSGGCAYVSVVTVTVHSTLSLSTMTYSTKPRSTTSVSSSSTSTSSNTGTDTLMPPARPTSLSTTTGATTSRVDVCPTGFYACSAVYHGGCCQTGRDCDTTSCPTMSSTTYTSNGVTIVEPVTTGASTHTTGSCAHGWFSCADTAGGGCCPTGFACGSSCTATAAKTTVAKEQATSNGGGLVMMGVGNLLGITVLTCLWGMW